MAFVKRNIGVQRTIPSRQDDPKSESTAKARPSNPPGTRPSPLTGRLTTSTGVASLDAYLGGHAGLATGSSLLIEESGTTDFAGAILKFFAAEGIVQGHCLHIVGGASEQWVQQLPGLSTSKENESRRDKSASDDTMKIAWRYQQLGQHAGGAAGSSRAPLGGPLGSDDVFCHSFDLAKRLVIPSNAIVHHVSIAPAAEPSKSPFTNVVTNVTKLLSSTPATTIHRIAIPAVLSPAFYPPQASSPQHFLQFLHSLRSLLRQHRDRLVMMMSIPTELYARTSGLVRWAEHVCDGVVELQPFAHLMESTNSLAESGGSRGNDEQPQGMLRLHKLPDLTERGARGITGAHSVGDDLAFTLSRRRFTIRPFSLPPMEGDQEAQSGNPAETGALQGTKKADIEF